MSDIPAPSEADLKRDAVQAHENARYEAAGPWIRRAVAAEAKADALQAMLKTFVRREIEVIGMDDSGFSLDHVLVRQAKELLGEVA